MSRDGAGGGHQRGQRPLCVRALADAFGSVHYSLKGWVNSSAPVMGLLLFWTRTKALIKIFLTACVFFIREDTHALGISAQL